MASESEDRTYTQTIRELSDRLVDAQRPIRVLDAVNWGPEIVKGFLDSRCRELPAVDRAYYEKRPLGFDPESKRREFQELERDIARRLGHLNPVGDIMKRMCREYSAVVEMLASRGTPEFTLASQQLYGSASDAFHAGEPTLAIFGERIAAALERIERKNVALLQQEKTITGEEAVERLRERLLKVFPDAETNFQVRLSDGIVADAAAGSDYIKIRKEALFNERDLRLLEIHEGWVHVGTTLNGSSQPVCTFLAKGPPSATLTQEGLAILTEILAFASHPGRVRRLTNRVQAVSMAESGADFLEVFEFFRNQSYNEFDSFQNTARVFRGSTPTGGPFTKDLTYSKGFILTYNYILLAVREGRLGRIPLLFCGKTHLEDMRVLAHLVEEGVVQPPRYLPEPFRDLSALSAWMCYSAFLSSLNLERLEADYKRFL